MLEKWKGAVDDKKIFGTFLTNLSKAFDCLSHELIIAKLNAYGFSLSALKLIFDYFFNRQQGTKINRDFSSWEEVLFGVPQGSVLGPILFNTFLGDLFLVMTENEFTSYVDDTTLYDADNTIEKVISSSQEPSEKLFKWFSDNQMQGTSGKCHMILRINELVKIQIGESLTESTKVSLLKKLLGVKIDPNFSFNRRIKAVCIKEIIKLKRNH